MKRTTGNRINNSNKAVNGRSRKAEEICCVNCSNQNCGLCVHCRGKKAFGGNGRDHQRCVQRQCLRLNPNAPIFHATAAPLNLTASGSDASDDDDHGFVKPQPRKRNRCLKCPGCKAKDCGKCPRCLGKLKFGGDGSDKQSCVERLCHVLYPIITPAGRTRERTSRRKRSAEHQPKVTSMAKNIKPAKRPRIEDSDQDFVTMSQHSSIILNENKDANEATESGTSDKSLFSLTSYLFEEDSRHFDKNRVVTLPEPTSLYGQEIPDEPDSNICAGCLGRRDAELSDDPILLCDGPHCGREYHLACCIPPLTSVPEDEEWLCQDCSPDGSTAALIQYLELADQAKSHYLSNSTVGRKQDHTYLEHLLRLDMAALGARRGEPILPESELDKSAMIHSLALCDANHSLARTRGGNERRAALSPSELIGKPIRLLLMNRDEPKYHTGRIVDYREVSSGEARSPPTSSPRKMSSPERSKSTDTEFLIRFPAGMDDRKTSHYHWIALEEHAVSIGSTIVWARISTGNWKPAILWLRTARALVSTMTSLPSSIDVEISKTKHKVCALARAFGDDVFAEVNVRDQCVDLLDRNAVDVNMNKANLLPFTLAKTELAEQERVRSWRELKQIDPMGPTVLSSRDYLSLPELESCSETVSEVAKSKSSSATIAPIPNIRHGIDRSKLLSMLHQRGFNPTKDMAASLSCEIVPHFDARTMAVILCDEKPSRNDSLCP